MDSLEKLLAIEEIKNLKARYFRHIDFKEWPEYAALFSPDFIGYTDQGEVAVRGGIEFAERVKQLLDSSQSVHHSFTPEIQVLSPTTASGLWPMEDRISWREGDACGMTRMDGCGHYHETYERRDGRWLIASLKLTRLRIEIDRARPAGA